MVTIIHQYFKGEFEDMKVLVQINPETLRGLEIIVDNEGNMQKTKRVFNEDIYEDLEADGFEESSALEFNLYLKGIK